MLVDSQHVSVCAISNSKLRICVMFRLGQALNQSCKHFKVTIVFTLFCGILISEKREVARKNLAALGC